MVAGTGGTGGAGGAAGTPARTLAPTFTAIYDEIFKDLDQSCDLGLCHMGTSMAFIDKAGAYSAIVGVAATGPACGTGGMKLVDPMKPATSLLYLKLQPMPPCGSQMRLSGPYLETPQLDQIKKWIEMGAPNN